MNLVQINERLKDLPMQVVQQYANGMNPEVPPYLALGELQRREIAQKQMATAQGAAQGPQPSVKEQVEQKAGLMAAQGLQQQQMMQQMAQPRGPMPVPAGMPQPEDQPEAMARGGLAAVPVRRDMFEYASGGIIAFATGGEVDAARQEAKDALAKLRSYGLRQRQQDPEGYSAAEAAAAAAQEKRQAIESAYAQEMSATGAARPATSRQDVGAVREAMQQAPAEPVVTSQGPGDRFAPRRPVAPATGIAAALEGAAPIGQTPPAATGARPPAPPRPAAPAGIAAALPQQAPTNTSPFMAEAATMAREKPVAPTPESIIAEQNKLLPPAMQEAAVQKRLADQRARAEQERTAFEKSRPSGLDDLIRVFGQSGQYKGLSGMAPAYTANIDRKRAEEAAMERRQNELMTAIEGREYEGAKELFGAREKSLTAANKSFQDRLMTNTKTLADLAGVDQRRMDESANRLNQLEITKLREATQNRSLNEKLKFEADYLSLKAQARSLAEKGDAPGAAKLEARANDMLSIRSGGGGTAAVGAGRNAIMERRQTMAELEKIIKDEGMIYSDADKKQAADQYRRLALMNVKDGEGGGGSAPPPAAVDALRKNPGLAAQFNQKYGPNASAQYLQK